MKKDVVLLKSDMGNLVATVSGIWLCKNDEVLSVSWEEINAAQQSVQSDKVHAERTMSMSCPSCHRLIEVVLLASLRQ